MLVVFIWLGSLLPDRYTETIKNCQSYPGNRCVLLQQVHQKLLFEKYKDLLHLSQPRLDSLIMVERADILRLLYLYDKGGIYSDLDNKIDYSCLEKAIKRINLTFFFGQEQRDNTKPSNNFIYSPTPEHPQLKRVIQKIHECEQCTDLNFASPYFLSKIGVTFRPVGNCIKHSSDISWYWEWNKFQKSPQEARKQAYTRAMQDRDAAGDPEKQKALAQKRAQQKIEEEKRFILGQAEADKLAKKKKGQSSKEKKQKSTLPSKIDNQDKEKSGKIKENEEIVQFCRSQIKNQYQKLEETQSKYEENQQKLETLQVKHQNTLAAMMVTVAILVVSLLCNTYLFCKNKCKKQSKASLSAQPIESSRSAKFEGSSITQNSNIQSRTIEDFVSEE